MHFQCLRCLPLLVEQCVPSPSRTIPRLPTDAFLTQLGLLPLYLPAIVRADATIPEVYAVYLPPELELELLPPL
jgi:hypothetical protein